MYGFIVFRWFEMEFSDLSLTSQLKVHNLLIQVHIQIVHILIESGSKGQTHNAKLCINHFKSDSVRCGTIIYHIIL